MASQAKAARPSDAELVDQRTLPRYVGQSQVAKMPGKSVRTIQRWREGNDPDNPPLPKPLRNGRQQWAWRVDDILAWDDKRRAAAQRSLIEAAIETPDDIRDDQLPDAIEALGSRLAALHGDKVAAGDVLGIAVKRQPTPEETTEIQRAIDAARAAYLETEFETWGKLFATLDEVRAMAVANWMFPALRKQWSDAAREKGAPWPFPADEHEAEKMAWATLATADGWTGDGGERSSAA